MRCPRAHHLSGFGRRALLAMVAASLAALALASALTTTASAQGGCPATGSYDEYTATTGDWSDVSNWAVDGDTTDNALPVPGEVACWASTTTVTIGSADTEAADSIDAGGDLIVQGTLTLSTSTASIVEDLTLDGGGTIDGPATAPDQLLTVESAFNWGDVTSGDATVGSTMAITAGTLAIDGTTSTPDLDGGSISSAATTISGPNFAASGSPTVTSTGTITFDTASDLADSDATFSAAGVVPIAGDFGFGTNGLTLTGGTTSLVSGETLDSGPLTISGGTTTVASGATLDSSGALTLTAGTVTNGGTVDSTSTAISGGTLQVDGTLGSSATLTGGTLDGTGTVTGSITNTSGTVSPGDPPGTGVLTATGAFSQTGGTLDIQINGSTPGTGFSQLKSTGGTTALGGTLSLSGTYTPVQGDSLAVVTYSSSSGTKFTSVTGTNAGDYVPEYGATSFTLTALLRPANCPSPDDVFTPTTGNSGDWSTGGTWLPAVPGAGDVACWSTGTTVTVGSGDNETVGEVQGGALDIDGGQLTLDSATDASTLATSANAPAADALDLIDGGSLNGLGQTLTVTGNMDWGGTGANKLDTAASPDNALSIAQGAGGSSLTVNGTGSTAWGGGSVATGAVTIGSSNLTDTNAPTLTATGVVTFSGVDLAASATPGTITAAGIVNSGTSSVLGFDLDVTANSTLAGTLNVQNLTTAADTTMTVPASVALNVYSGAISGTISGAGTFTAGEASGGAATTILNGGTVSTTLADLIADSLVVDGGATLSSATLHQSGGTLTVGGTLSSAGVTVTGGTLTVDSGATYDAATATTVGPGTVDLENGSSTTGNLTLTGAGQLGSPSHTTLTVTGTFTWSAGTINPSDGSLAIDQTGTAALSGTLALDGGSITSGSLSTSNGTALATANAPTVSTSSTLTLGAGTSITGATATFSAAGVVAGAGTTGTYGFGSNALLLPGGTTTVASGTTLAAASTTLNGGTLDGTGTVAGPVENSSGTLAPGSPVGVLTITGNYSQVGGTLAINVDGTTGGSGYSQLNVVGTTSLGGDLSLTDGGGFIPEPGDTFEIVGNSVASQGGAFALTGTGAGSYFAVYSPTNVTLDVNPGPANIGAPAIAGTAGVGQTLSCSQGTWSANPDTFSYQWNSNGTPISGATSSTYVITAADQGNALTCTVTASNSFGPGQPATSAAVSVPAPPPAVVAPVNTAAPAVTGTPTPGSKLSCLNGTWLGSPTGFTYQWYRNGSSIAGATGATYTVQIADEASSLKCVVTASNTAGAGTPVSSAARVVALAGTLTCAKPTGKLSGVSLGRISLGTTRTKARRALTRRLSTAGEIDYFCLYGGWGIHAGYPSSKLLRSLPAKKRGGVKGKVVLALTVNPFYALDGARPGMALSAVAKRLHVGKVFRIGLNRWYIAPGASSEGVLRVRGGIIQEVGIANKALTKGRAAQQRFLTGFNSA